MAASGISRLGLFPIRTHAPSGFKTWRVCQTRWLPPLSYSPQFAAFNLIVRAVGHHILQLFVLVDVSQWSCIHSFLFWLMSHNGAASIAWPGIPGGSIVHILGNREP